MHDYPTSDLSAVAIADLNGDGREDLVASNYNSLVTVLLGDGTGSFGPVMYFGGGYDAAAIAVGDLNGDGKLDVVTANNRSSSASVLLANGDGSLHSHVDYPTGGSPFSIALGDLNGDGHLDVVTDSHGSDYSAVSVLLGNGDGSLAPPMDYPTTYFPRSVAVADLDGDGKLDVVTANGTTTGSGTISVLLQTTSEFGPPRRLRYRRRCHLDRDRRSRW